MNFVTLPWGVILYCYRFSVFGGRHAACVVHDCSGRDIGICELSNFKTATTPAALATWCPPDNEGFGKSFSAVTPSIVVS